MNDLADPSVPAKPVFGAPSQLSVSRSGFIFETAPFPQCHASTIVETGGRLVAAWFGGSAEKHPDVGIWLSRCDSGYWCPPVEVANGVTATKREPCWNPVLFQPTHGPLLLFYKVGPSPSTWWGMLTTSTDGGETWSRPQRLPDGIFGPIKNKPVQTARGEILCPSSTEHDGWRIHFEFTADCCASWRATEPLNDPRRIGAIQPSILRHSPTRLQALGRTQQGSVFTIESHDSGRTWGPISLTSIPNPDSGTDAITLQDGRHLLVYNHSRTARTPLNVALSSDGHEWIPALELETAAGEYSYPAVIQAADGRVHISYTWNRTRIKHTVLDISP